MKQLSWFARILLSLVLLNPGNLQAEQQAKLWQAVANGEAVVLMRHAIAPGNGDPENFDITDCATQRNLSSEGLQQAMQIGDLFRAHAIDKADVFSSQWCRCIDTAVSLKLGGVNPLPILNSFYQNRSTQVEQTQALSQWIKRRLASKQNNTALPSVLVTHQVNITGLTGVYPRSGEIVFIAVDGGNLLVRGRAEVQ